MMLLNDKELEEMDFSYEGMAKTSREVGRHVKRLVAKAQLKKVVKWIEERVVFEHGKCDDSCGHKNFGTMDIERDELEALLKEIKD